MATYYVRADGTVSAANRANAALGTGGDPTDKTKCLNHLQFYYCTYDGHFSAGDIIEFNSRGGVFTSPSAGVHSLYVSSHAENKNYTIRGDEGYRPVFYSSAGLRSILVAGGDNVSGLTLSNLEVTSTDGASMLCGTNAGSLCNNLTLSDLYVHDVAKATDADYNGVGVYGNNAIITRCTIDNIANDGIWVSGADPVITDNRITRVSQNPATGAHGDGIQLTPPIGNFTVRGNYIDRTGGTSNGQAFIISNASAGTGGVFERNTVIWTKSTDLGPAVYCDQPNAIIRGNYIYGGNTGVHVLGDGTLVYGNLVLMSGGLGIQLWTSASGLKVINNTIVSSGAQFYGIYVKADVTDALAKNNICVGFDYGLRDSGTTSDIGYNVLYGNTTGAAQTYTPGATDVLTDPLLQSDYSLGSGSPARGAGVWIAGVRAYDDLPLPLAPDIGAVQDRTAPGRRFGAGGGKR